MILAITDAALVKAFTGLDSDVPDATRSSSSSTTG